MILLDSNLIIYSALAEFYYLLEFIEANAPYVSAISQIEVLGFQRLNRADIRYFESFFKSTTILPVSDKVILEAIGLRQQRKMKLGDSIVAATALVYEFSLATHNIKDSNG